MYCQRLTKHLKFIRLFQYQRPYHYPKCAINPFAPPSPTSGNLLQEIALRNAISVVIAFLNYELLKVLLLVSGCHLYARLFANPYSTTISFLWCIFHDTLWICMISSMQGIFKCIFPFLINALKSLMVCSQSMKAFSAEL